ncbi:hypothetical protein GF339_23150 [candidate division KSB3 bacterium]|uniref:Uncharacterized protein n=1 Tax=candidate division KSB3 bacterium TaxID=2044937 RepID=A0A9D5K0R0_9BACT|nr:hypothetical protein [candidate division KSB3 bacterium]MBD3327501.1 hypothetical protein [candidate division KSB3 bacterium]
MKKSAQRRYIIWGWWLGIVLLLAGCANFGGGQTPPGGGSGYGTPPALSNLAISPNPSSAGRIVNLTTTYVDADADLHFGVAAVAIDGKNLSRIAFHSPYPSGVLTIPFAISYYTRPSDIRITLKVRDSYGNWSNAVSTVLSVR